MFLRLTPVAVTDSSHSGEHFFTEWKLGYGFFSFLLPSSLWRGQCARCHGGVQKRNVITVTFKLMEYLGDTESASIITPTRTQPSDLRTALILTRLCACAPLHCDSHFNSVSSIEELQYEMNLPMHSLVNDTLTNWDLQRRPKWLEH